MHASSSSALTCNPLDEERGGLGAKGTPIAFALSESIWAQHTVKRSPRSVAD